ncbi:MAG: zinc-ribbon domain-containing protein [Lachnospiraceae bacterium]|nr:zinc-ribbon domain-containing protein [Lachnospiraceae bacterium]
MFCRNCGEKITDEGMFCPRCGYQVRHSVTTEPVISVKCNIRQGGSVLQGMKKQHYPKETRKKRLVILIAVLFCIIFCTGAALGARWYWSAEQKIIRALDKEDYEEAYNIFMKAEDADASYLKDALSEHIETLQVQFLNEEIDYATADEELQMIERMKLSGIRQQVREARAYLIEINLSKTAFQTAENFAAEGKYAEALIQYRNVLKDDIHYREAQEGLINAGELYRSMILEQVNADKTEEKYNEALLKLQEALSIMPEDLAFAEEIAALEREIEEQNSMASGNEQKVYEEASGGQILSGESYPAFIAFGGDAAAENDWGFQYYGDGASTNLGEIVATNGELKNGETTTLTLEFPSEVFYTWFTAPCFVAEDASVISPESTFEVKVFLDGEEIATDLFAGKTCWAQGTGDYADTQCVRICGGYNEWGDKYLAESPKGFKILTFEITPTIYVTAGEDDFKNVYHAYLGLQTPTWIFRNPFDDATYGKDSGYYDQLIGFQDGDLTAMGGTFTDAEITGNGTYTVSLTGFDFSGQFEGSNILGETGTFNLLFVSTDLPVDAGIVISNVVLKMDGKTIARQENAFLDKDSEYFQNVLMENIWERELEELPYYTAPEQSIEISFTVSGF